METLAALVARNGRLDAAIGAGWVVRLAKRVEELHRLGVAHGGLSAMSVLVDAASYRANGALADVRRVPATAAYHSPERCAGGGISEADDTWAMAVLLYQLVTGQAPYPGGTESQVLDRIRAGPPPPLAAAGVQDEGVQRLLGLALEPQLERRICKASQLRQWLERCHPDPAVGTLAPLAESADEPTDEPSFDLSLNGAEVQVAPGAQGTDDDEELDLDNLKTVARDITELQQRISEVEAQRAAAARAGAGSAPPPASDATPLISRSTPPPPGRAVPPPPSRAAPPPPARVAPPAPGPGAARAGPRPGPVPPPAGAPATLASLGAGGAAVAAAGSGDDEYVVDLANVKTVALDEGPDRELLERIERAQAERGAAAAAAVQAAREQAAPRAAPAPAPVAAPATLPARSGMNAAAAAAMPLARPGVPVAGPAGPLAGIPGAIGGMPPAGQPGIPGFQAGMALPVAAEAPNPLRKWLVLACVVLVLVVTAVVLVYLQQRQLIRLPINV
ncbi:MAG: hypothetical protein HY744_18720 [Deltaproteobacteria bacterium]|nr:hypothetical protein [Deltaproteobacteria bacterium]